MDFKQYKRKEVAELQKIDQKQIDFFNERGIFPNETAIASISDADFKNGSPKIGDQWFVEKIKERWSFTDQVIYKTPEIKLASLIEATKKVIAQN